MLKYVPNACMVVAIAAGLAGCSQEPGSGRAEYSACTTAPECALGNEEQGLQCTPLGAAPVCVDTPCTEATCECYGSTACGTDACLWSNTGFRCVPSASDRAEHVRRLMAATACAAPDGLEVRFTLADPWEATIKTQTDPVVTTGPVQVERADGETIDLSTEVQSAEFVPRPRQGDTPLIVFALDNSQSLFGGVDGMPPDPNRATDVRDDRIAFFYGLLPTLNTSAPVSVVSFQKQRTVLDGMGAAPTRNRDITAGALMMLERGADGGTPLAQALREIPPAIMEPHAELAPILVLFTDGIEGGDTSDDAERSAMRAQVQAYADAQIPVIVLELKPPSVTGHAQTPDPLLVELACATGGAYLFLDNGDLLADGFTDQVRRLIDGTWRLRMRADLSDVPPGAHRLSTSISLESKESMVSQQLQQTADSDTRPWLLR